jgi:hypothetical protein
LTGEELGAPQIPYPIALAVGPGEQGTVVALGRGDRVLAFLRGESAGDLPAAVNGLLPKRGHAWLYVPIPDNVSEQVLSSGAPGLKDNPMAVGMVKAFDQVKELGLNLNFGVTAMDIEVAFGCRSSQSAKEMADGLQGFLGMMQMAAAQNPATTPQFLSKLQVKSEGASFRLTTAVTVRDLQLAQQQAGGPAGRASSASQGSGKATVVVDPLVTPGKPPVTLEYLEIMPEQGSHIRRGKFRATNESERAVREIRVTFHYRDARGVQLGEWNRVQRDPYSEVLLPAARERVLEWPLFNLPFATRDVSLTLQEVIFSDGERWTAIR